MKKLLAPLVATALILGGSAAFADDAVKAPADMKKPPMHDRFKEADTNGDGFITKDEMKAEQEKHIDKMFEETDLNKDGKLSKEEMQKGREAMKQRWKDRKDGDHKGPPPAGDKPADPAAPPVKE